LSSKILTINYVPAVEIDKLKPLQNYRPSSEVLNELASTIGATMSTIENKTLLVQPIIVSQDFYIIDGVKRVEVLKDLARNTVNAMVVMGLKCGDSELDRLRCLGLRVALNTVRWETIGAADRRRVVFTVAREVFNIFHNGEINRIKESLAKGEVPRVLVDTVIKATGMPYSTVYRSIQYIVTIPQLKRALLNYDKTVDARPELFDLPQSIIEKLRSVPEDARDEIIRRFLEGELSKIEVSKVAEKVSTPKAVVEVTTGGKEETTKEGREETKEVSVERAVTETRLEKIRERVEESVEGSVKELIEAIRTGSIDEDRIFVYELRRQYPEDLMRPIFLVLENAVRVFEDFIFPDKIYLYRLANEIERISLVFGERDVIPALFRLVCAITSALTYMPQFSSQDELVKTICRMINSVLRKYEKQGQVGGQA
jgi:nitrogen regulatory protein PII